MNLKDYKYLNIKGTVLDNYQLKNYMEKVATNHDIENNSQKSTYPIPRLKDNFRFIEKTYELLNEHAKMGINTHSAGEWLLDNFYIIEETYKTVCLEMNLKKYKEFPGIANGMYKGYARVYVLASEIVAYTDNKINDEILAIAISAYQKRKLLNMEEIWSLWIFLEIAIIENIRSICEKIYSSQMQKYKVENIIERLVEKKETKSQVFKNEKSNSKLKIENKEMKYPFIEYMSYKLKKYGRQGLPYLEILEDQVNKMGMTISEVIKKEHYDIAISKVSIGNSIISLKETLRVNFLSLFEQINGVEEILKKDPARVYSKMDYTTKDKYRNEIKKLSEETKISEIYIANKIIELSNRYTEEENKKGHIGYYLISDGKNELLKELGFKGRKTVLNKTKERRYVFGVFAFTSILTILSGVYLYFNYKNLIVSILAAIILYIPISEIVIQLINYILSKTVKPKIIPKLDFSKSLPKEYSTFVVIPTIINSAEKVKELIRKLEVYYLANKSENLYFALLGDCTASTNKEEDFDDDVIRAGLKEVERLNSKYKQNSEELPKFHFLYRNREWNEGEQCYLGWERKRGLLCEFNEFLIDGINHFRINTLVAVAPQGDPQNSHNIKYVITLDADTNLVLGTALELIGTMAHILNKPILNSKKDIVIDGHALIQPRVGIDLESSRKSLFTKLYAGFGGTDSYTNAISDIYQDNFDEGIFTGKGIYDVEIFHKILCDEIPENTVLSHDLLEGSYLRCGLATDILLLDDYPSKYNTHCLRQARWIRGDFQISKWLKNKITVKDGSKKKNPLRITL